MKLMAAYDRAFAADDGVGEKLRGAIAEMQFALGEARGVAEQAGHGVRTAFCIFETLAQNHVAAALAVHRPCCGEASGAAVALLLVRAALACHTGMATFAEAGVSDKPADAATPKAAG